MKVTNAVSVSGINVRERTVPPHSPVNKRIQDNQGAGTICSRREPHAVDTEGGCSQPPSGPKYCLCTDVAWGDAMIPSMSGE